MAYQTVPFLMTLNVAIKIIHQQTIASILIFHDFKFNWHSELHNSSATAELYSNCICRSKNARQQTYNSKLDDAYGLNFVLYTELDA